MALPLVLQIQLSSPFTCSLSPSRVSCITRRIATTTALTTFILAREATLNSNTASSFQLSFTAPDQTPEEAEAGIRIHAKDLLRQDLYTIIQAKPGSQRQQLRKLYSMLFNDVTRLDYAARDKDAVRVQEYYDNIVAALDRILFIS
uniref:PQL-like protein n=1 Tax=Acorus calamus var. americanus TaxID=263995 RepID=A0A0F7GY29_ACOCI